MATKKASKAKPRATQTAFRLSEKTQYGLRLLARIQGDSMTEAVEWAINLAMRTTRVGSGVEERRLNTIVDTVWSKPTEPQRIHYLSDTAPELLDFDQRAAWNLVKRCDDLWDNSYYAVTFDADDGPAHVRVDKDSPEREPHFDDCKPKFPIIEKHWDEIRVVGLALGRAGEIEMRFSLAEILDGTAMKRAGLVE